MLIVGKDELYKTIKQALDCVTDNDYTILIKNGIYIEKIVLDK
ncbi:MAG: hypothetical protein K0Q49_189 [Haloplasmataceae bacterium]|jgi:pectin methylesterase-like acyl-CoA thioesterase|nr:hypothetical protein [Haloplasmataceae bacterium]